jgi:hypothetical protein
MALLSDAKAYARLLFGLRGFLRRRMGPEEARARLRQLLAEREENFLGVCRRGIFDNPRSPYLPLFALAGCEFGDLARMVRSEGVDAAVEDLLDAGVYVTFEEFKGRKPIVRPGLEIPVDAEDFDNPHLSGYYRGESGGSTGPGTRILVDLDHVMQHTMLKVATFDAHGLLRVPTALWRGRPPAVAGLKGALQGSVMGNMPRRWFSPSSMELTGAAARGGIALDLLVLVARLLGTPFPRPEPVRLDQPDRVLEWAARTIRDEGACLIRAFVSASVRVCVAARERGIDLTGATFMGGGEPPTEAKVRAITDTGARYIPNYALSESGTVGVGCANPCDGNDLHVALENMALIQRPRDVPGWGISVNAFYLTTLMPSAPKIMLNVATDDFGVLERRSCGCPLDTLGYGLHVRDIRSYGKLTGEGVTLIHSDVVKVLEEALPARFGGGPLDYQLMEEEDEGGATRLSLLISPKIELSDEDSAVSLVLEALQRGGWAGTYAAQCWEQVGSIRVRRAEPLWSGGGKFMPLCVAERIKHVAANWPAAHTSGGGDTEHAEGGASSAITCAEDG